MMRGRLRHWQRLASGVVLATGLSGCLSDDNLSRPTASPTSSPKAVANQLDSNSHSDNPQSELSPRQLLISENLAKLGQRQGLSNSGASKKNAPLASAEHQSNSDDAQHSIVASGFAGSAFDAPHSARSNADVNKPSSHVIPTTSSDYPIDLAAALRLAATANPRIAIADEAVQAGREAQTLARAQVLPSLSGGVSYHWHDGTLQSASGIIRDLDSRFFYAGAGDMYGSNFAIPGVYLFANMSDAIFEPLAARQRVTGLLFTAQATRNTVLLEVAERYFALAAAEETLAAIEKSEHEFREVARLTANFAQSGQGRDSDADRARAEALLQHDLANQAEEAVAVASADLVQLLSLDAAMRLHTAGDGLVSVNLVDPETDLGSLLRIARGNRPEVAAAFAAIEEARTRMRQEKARPFLPLISAGISAGTFGGGSNLVGYSFDHFGGRMDFDVAAVWTLQDLGIGNVARVRTNRAILGQALADQQGVLERVAREVSEARALVLDRRAELETTRRQLETAEESYKLDLERARNLQGRPIELLNSARSIEQARQDMIRALAGYNQAQFRLHVALGQPPLATEAIAPAPHNP